MQGVQVYFVCARMVNGLAAKWQMYGVRIE